MRIFLFILGVLLAPPGQARELVVIVSSQVPDDTISVEKLADIYTLKKTFWSNGTLVVPVNREASSPLREKFSEAVFKLSPQELAEYWNRLQFQGKLPPVVQTSDEAVLGFVRNVPGAIGYIDASHAVTGVKVMIRIP